MIENPMLSLVQEIDSAKPSTPSRTLSRDSGITSPTPQEREKEAQADAADVEAKVEDEFPELMHLPDDHHGDHDDDMACCITPDLPEEPTLLPEAPAVVSVEVPQEVPTAPAEPESAVEATPLADEPEPEERDEPLVKQLSERDAKLAKVAQDKYQQQVSDMNDLVRKVNQWHAHLKPILKQSEQRNHFDIHEYGSEIIDAFPAEFTEERLKYQRPSLTFENLMANKGKDYTARFFLSTLQLVNANNIKLTAATRDPRKITPVSEIQLQLLSRVRHHQEMDNISDNLEKAVPQRPTKKAPAKRKRTNAAANFQFTAEDAAPAEKRPRCLASSPAEDLEFMKKLRQQLPTPNSDEAIKRRINFRRNLRRLANDDGFVDDEEIDEDDYLSCEDGYAGDVSANNTPDQPKEVAKEALLQNRPSSSKVVQWQQQIARSFAAGKPQEASSVADSGYLSTTMTETSILSGSNFQLSSTMLGGEKATSGFGGMEPISYPSSDEGIQMLAHDKRPLEDSNSTRNPSKFMKT
jgi:Condensin II complex subunit CAP-H2 or CNDH2, C-term